MSAPMKKTPYTSKTVDVDAFYRGLEEGEAAARQENRSPVQQQARQTAGIAETLRLVSILRKGPTPTSELFKLSELSLGSFAQTLETLKREGLVETRPDGGTDETLALTPAGAALTS